MSARKVEQERLAAEEAARKEVEEQERLAAEEAARKEAEGQERLAAEEAKASAEAAEANALAEKEVEAQADKKTAIVEAARTAAKQCLATEAMAAAATDATAEVGKDASYLVVQPGGHRRNANQSPHGGQAMQTPIFVATKATTATNGRAPKMKRTLPAVVSHVGCRCA